MTIQFRSQSSPVPNIQTKFMATSQKVKGARTIRLEYIVTMHLNVSQLT